MENLLVDYIEIKRNIERMGELVTSLLMCVVELEESIERVDITWNGEANQIFNVRMKSDFLDMKIRITKIKKMQQLLLSVHQNYQLTEGDIEERISYFMEE